MAEINLAVIKVILIFRILPFILELDETIYLYIIQMNKARSFFALFIQ